MQSLPLMMYFIYQRRRKGPLYISIIVQLDDKMSEKCQIFMRLSIDFSSFSLAHDYPDCFQEGIAIQPMLAAWFLWESLDGYVESSHYEDNTRENCNSSWGWYWNVRKDCQRASQIWRIFKGNQIFLAYWLTTVKAECKISGWWQFKL